MFFYRFDFRKFVFVFFFLFCTEAMGSVQFVKNRCTTLINEGKIVEAIDLAGENTFRNEIEKLAKNKLEEYIQHSTMCPFEVMTLANMR